ncbi:MAG: hypothetical protein R2728_08335 [Chitinophagales bacterium]
MKKIKLINLTFFKVILIALIAGNFIAGNCGCDDDTEYVNFWVQVNGVQVDPGFPTIASWCWPGTGTQQQINPIQPIINLLTATSGNGLGYSLIVSVNSLGNDCPDQNFTMFYSPSNGGIVRGHSNPGGSSLNCTNDAIINYDRFSLNVPVDYDIDLRVQLIICNENCIASPSGFGYLIWETTVRIDPAQVAGQNYQLNYLNNLQFISRTECDLYFCQ